MESHPSDPTSVDAPGYGVPSFGPDKCAKRLITKFIYSVAFLGLMFYNVINVVIMSHKQPQRAPRNVVLRELTRCPRDIETKMHATTVNHTHTHTHTHAHTHTRTHAHTHTRTHARTHAHTHTHTHTRNYLEYPCYSVSLSLLETFYLVY